MITGGIATIMVRDFDRAVRFYTETLGLELKFRAGNEWAEVIAGQALTIGLHPWSPGHGPEPGQASGISIGFGVDPIDKAVAALRSKGITFRGPIQDNNNVKLAFFADPDGNPLYLCEVKPMPARAEVHAGDAKSAHT
jgi:catechol 2,3-dioxygenase-like lactoylglutathione lyase family enzyme